jgi:CheY-like chemotaxis protein
MGRVLVVDDDEVIRRLIEVNLSLEGFEVSTAVDGQDCLDKVAEINPDVITLDVMMPRLDGWETAVQLRNAPETAHIKVLLITARAQEDDKARGARVGADAYLTKPFDPNEMIRLVRELVGPRLVITAELRRAILAAAGRTDGDPQLRPAGGPGRYASSLPFRLTRPGQDPRAVAAVMAARLETELWIATAEVAGAGYLTVTVTPDALAALAVRIPRAGPACAASDALRGCIVPAPPPADPLTEPTWSRARATLAAQLTPRLATTAGATLFSPERGLLPPPAPEPPAPGETRPVVPAIPATRALGESRPVPNAADHVGVEPEPVEAAVDYSVPGPGPGPVVAAVDYAGPDAVRFALARMPPGGPAPEPALVARHVLANPAYAVRYAHAAAAAVLRWAAALGTSPAGFRPRLLAEPPGSDELALLDVLSWLPERVAVAAGRGRPDEFAGYLEELATRTIDTMNTTGFTTISSISSERLWLADAARTALATGLGLLGVGAPGRL